MSNPVNHFEIVGKDGAKLQKFYGDLFGWKIDASNPMNYGMVQAEEGGIGGGVTGGERPAVTFYVTVADLAASLKKAESLGGKTVMAPMDVPGGPKIAVFSDPEGNVIGLAKADSM
jgi:predicted enzyme related to lactoylglutathione lyase